MKTRKALQSDLERMLEIEESAIPGYGYLFENKDFYFDGIQNQGEMILALKDDIPVGMGQYSLLPDGSGWLEILRVHKDFQHQGAGRAIYKRYMELAEKTDAPYIAMFTGRKNIASKSLAEKNNFKLAAAHFEYSLDLSDKSEISDDSFHLIQDAKEAEQLIQKESNSWGRFMGLNRTYFHMGTPLYQWLTKKKMVYLTDNCGEIVFDKLLIRKIKEMNPELDITVIVRGGKVLNDATMEDAQMTGLSEIVEVIGNGDDVAGTILSRVSPECLEIMEQADVILAKGQGNFESLHGCGKNIYYLFLCKCDWFMRKFHAKRFQGMFVNEKRIEFL